MKSHHEGTNRAAAGGTTAPARLTANPIIDQGSVVTRHAGIGGPSRVGVGSGPVARRGDPWTAFLRWHIAVPIVGSAFVDAPQLLRVGGVSGLALLTLALTALAAWGVVACPRHPRRVLRATAPFLVFLVWTALSIVWLPPKTFINLQNAIVYTLFGLQTVVAGAVAARDAERTRRVIAWAMRWLDWVVLPVVLASLITGGMPHEEGVWLVGARSVGLLGTLAVAWHMAAWYYGAQRSMVWVVLWIAAITASLSRTAMATSLVVVGVTVLLQLRFRPGRASVGLVLLLAVPAAAGGALLAYNETFHDRFFAGDTSIEVGGVGINASGRMDMWAVVLQSGRQHPIVGKGVGSSMAVLDTAFGSRKGMDHPHNDYLRVWHDFGLVGLVLVLMAVTRWLGTLLRGWYRAERSEGRPAQLELAAAGALFALLLVMLTDNAVVYVFVMAPLATIVGAGLGAALHPRGIADRGARARPAATQLAAE